MSIGYIVRPRADRDIDEIADYLSDEAGLETGLEFLADVYKTLSLVASQREMGWPCRIKHPQLLRARTLRVSTRFEKYLIFYQPYEDRVEILRVLHGARDLTAVFKKQLTG